MLKNKKLNQYKKISWNVVLFSEGNYYDQFLAYFYSNNLHIYKHILYVYLYLSTYNWVYVI